MTTNKEGRQEITQSYVDDGNDHDERADDEDEDSDPIPIASAKPVPSTSSITSTAMSQQSRPLCSFFDSEIFVDAKDNATLDAQQLRTLLGEVHGFPQGLAKELGDSIAAYPLRFWIIDNSGSMRHNDGNLIVSCGDRLANSDQPMGSKMNSSNNSSKSDVLITEKKMVACTRWMELVTAVQYHMELAGLLRVMTIFRFLNHPGTKIMGHDEKQEFIIGRGIRGGDARPDRSSSVEETSTETTNKNAEGDDNNHEEDRVDAASPRLGRQRQQQRQRCCQRVIDTEVRTAKDLLSKVQPSGVTPLTEHILSIYEKIRSVRHSLIHHDQRAVVVVATDGLPSDRYGNTNFHIQEEFVMALRQLQTLSVVWIVIRLCTNDDYVMEYYNALDRQLEFPLEVVDDYVHEGSEIHEHNKFINYTIQLHRCREMGYHHQILDLLDERKLNKDEVLELLRIIFGRDMMRREVPYDVHTEWKQFCTALGKLVRSFDKQYNPIKRKLDYWIDVKQLERSYRETSTKRMTKYLFKKSMMTRRVTK